MNVSPRQMADDDFARMGDPNVPARLKRLAGTVAFLALVFAVLGLVGMLFEWRGGPAWRNVTLANPPPLYAASLPFFAIGLGVVSFWAVKQMPKRLGVRVMALSAVLVGLVGPPVYTMQAFKIHLALQQGEVERVEAITKAALDFRASRGRFPADILELAQFAKLTPGALKTTFGSDSKLAEIPALTARDGDYGGILHEFEGQCDFVYLAGNIDKAETPPAAEKLIVARSKYKHLESESAAVGFVDGKARWISLVDAEEMYKEDDAARKEIGVAARVDKP